MQALDVHMQEQEVHTQVLAQEEDGTAQVRDILVLVEQDDRVLDQDGMAQAHDILVLVEQDDKVLAQDGTQNEVVYTDLKWNDCKG